MTPFSALVFDLDGTLIHSAPDIHAAANVALQKMGRQTLDLPTIISFIGNGIGVLTEHCLNATGGSESCLTYGSLLAWQALRVMATDTCRPFCVDRKGMVLGEGAGILVLERLDDAKARGARIYAELAGTGLSSDAGSLTDPSSEGAALAMRRAMKDAGLAADAVKAGCARCGACSALSAYERRRAGHPDAIERAAPLPAEVLP